MKKLSLLFSHWLLTIFLLAGLQFNATAQIGTHLNFDGVNDVVSVSSTSISSTLTGSNGLTLEAWVKSGIADYTSANIYNTGTIISNHRPGGATQFNLRTNGTKYEFFVGFGAYIVSSPSAAITPGAWQHIAAVFNGSTIKLYVNAVLVGTTNTPGYTLPNSTEGVTIGNSGYGEQFNGNIDEVRIWNTALSADDIARTKNCELQGSEPGLYAYYTFNEGIAGGTNTATTTLNNGTATAGLDGTLINMALTGSGSNWLDGSPVISGSIIPEAPTVTAQNFCGSYTIANLVPAPSATIKWYNVATGGTPLASTAALVAGTYYAAAVNANGCESIRSSVSITIGVPLAPPTAYTQNICGGGTVANLSPAPSEIHTWYSTATGGAALPDTTPLANGTYFVSATNGPGCESTRTPANVIVLNSPTMQPLGGDDMKSTAPYQSYIFATTKAPDGKIYNFYIDLNPPLYANQSRAVVRKYNGTSWQEVASKSLGVSNIASPSLAVDSSGTPYVAYLSVPTAQIKVVKFNDTGWVYMDTASILQQNCSEIKITIGNDGAPNIFFQSNGIPMAMKYNGNSWVSLSTSPISAGTVTYLDQATDNLGTNYLIYSDDLYAGKATVVKFDGTNWITVGNPGFTSSGAFSTQIAIDKNNMPFVLFANNTITNDRQITVMKFDGTNWVTVGAAGWATCMAQPGFGFGITSCTSLAIDTSGVPYVLFRNIVTGGKLTVNKFDNTNWVTAGDADISDQSITRKAILLIDENNILNAFYSVNRSIGKKLVGQNWVISGDTGITANKYDSKLISMATDKFGTPYIAYKDFAYDGKLTVKKYDGTNWVIVGQPGISEEEIVSTSIGINPVNGLIVVAYGLKVSQFFKLAAFDGTNWTTYFVNYQPNTGNDPSYLSTNVQLRYNSNGTFWLGMLRTKEINNTRYASQLKICRSLNNLSLSSLIDYTGTTVQIEGGTGSQAVYDFSLSAGKGGKCILNVENWKFENRLYAGQYTPSINSWNLLNAAFVPLHTRKVKIIADSNYLDHYYIAYGGGNTGNTFTLRDPSHQLIAPSPNIYDYAMAIASNGDLYFTYSEPTSKTVLKKYTRVNSQIQRNWVTLDSGFTFQPRVFTTLSLDANHIPVVAYADVEDNSTLPHCYTWAKGLNKQLPMIYTDLNQQMNFSLKNENIFSTNCEIIARLKATLNFSVDSIPNAKVWIENTQNPQYVKRHYQLKIAGIISISGDTSGRVTLYFKQQEFTDYNAVNANKLPANPTDSAGIANLLIDVRQGESGDNSGLPGSYSNSISTVNPADANIVWNNIRQWWEVSFNVTNFNSGYFVKTPAAVLPLHLLNFTAAKQANDNVLLQWLTTNELNVNHFEVERSVTGNSFEKIGTVTARNLAANNSYQLTDNAAWTSDVRYYRLKSVDDNGKFSYSPVVKLNSKQQSSISIYPNPATDAFVLNTNNSLLNTTVKIIDMSGSTVMVFTVNNRYQQIDVSGLTKGLYVLRFEDGSSAKLIKE